jgi:aryl-alcohol dehydrogenase-like predicted oxidoreductase
VEYRELGTTGCDVSRLGFGCGAASGHDYGPVDESAWTDAVRAALDSGINFFDVADVYGFGRAEELLSRALGKKRHEVIIATKGGLVWNERGGVRREATRAQISRAIENSLRRLRVNAIPLYQIHWPDPATPVEETLETLAKFQDQGKIRFVGVSNFSLQLLQQAFRVCPIASHQAAYNLLSREAEIDVLPWCQKTQTAMIAHTVLARGLLAGKRSIGSSFIDPDTRQDSLYFSGEGRIEKQQLLDTLRRISERTGRSVGSIAIRWVLDNSKICTVLVGVKHRAQLDENLTAVGWRLETGDRELLSNFSSLCPRGLAGTPAHETVSR